MKTVHVFLVLALTLCGCSSQKKEKITPEVPSFQKPENATVRLEGQAYPYCLWYNPEQWIIVNTPFDSCDEASEWTLVLADLEGEVSIGKNLEKKAIAKTYTYEEKNVSQTAYKDFVQKKFMSQNKENLLAFKDLGSEERIVNGLKLFSWKFQVEYKDIGSITTFLYFYSDSDGSVSVTTFTPSDKWKKNEKEMENLLNGFCLLQTGS